MQRKSFERGTVAGGLIRICIAVIAIIVAVVVLVNAIQNWDPEEIGGKVFMHLQLDAPEPRIAIKLPPEMGMELRERYDAVRPAYHMNKRHWNDIYLEHNELTDSQIET